MTEVSPKKTTGSSPEKFRTPTKKSNNFPTTPSSVEKQKKMLKARLKRLLEQNLKLTATNTNLKRQSKEFLNQACVSFHILLVTFVQLDR